MKSLNQPQIKNFCSYGFIIITVIYWHNEGWQSELQELTRRVGDRTFRPNDISIHIYYSGHLLAQRIQNS